MSWEGIGVILTAIGVAYAIYRGESTRTIAKRAEQREQRLEEERQEAQKKAELVPRIGSVPGWKQKSLLIENRGQATARNVEVWINEMRAETSDFVLNAPSDYERIEPSGQPPAFHLTQRAMSHPARLRVQVRWDDDFQEGRERETELSW